MDTVEEWQVDTQNDTLKFSGSSKPEADGFESDQYWVVNNKKILRIRLKRCNFPDSINGMKIIKDSSLAKSAVNY